MEQEEEKRKGRGDLSRGTRVPSGRGIPCSRFKDGDAEMGRGKTHDLFPAALGHRDWGLQTTPPPKWKERRKKRKTQSEERQGTLEKSMVGSNLVSAHFPCRLHRTSLHNQARVLVYLGSTCPSSHLAYFPFGLWRKEMEAHLGDTDDGISPRFAILPALSYRILQHRSSTDTPHSRTHLLARNS